MRQTKPWLFAICLVLLLLPVGCQTTVTPAPTRLSATATSIPLPTQTPEPTPSETAIPFDAVGLLRTAVTRLQDAQSFRLVSHNITAYQAVAADGTITTVYGEFDDDYAVIRQPSLKIHHHSQYRYDPHSEYATDDTYSYQEGGKFYAVDVSATGDTSKNEIEWRDIEPINGDVVQTLINYSDKAQFVSTDGTTAVYTLDHPEWYTLRGAIGFADLSLLYYQENGAELVKEYVEQNYPNVKTFHYTIYVDIEQQTISKVVVDNRDFMLSVWQEVDRALVEQGADPQTLTQYTVLDANSSEYLFSDYDQVEDFALPDVST